MVIVLTPSVFLHATHIVGGDLTYRFVERQGANNKYVITLKIYYDCFPADGMAAVDSDSTITLGVYRRTQTTPTEKWALYGNNNSIRMISLRRQPLSTIPNPVYECLKPPDRICVFEGVYEFELIVERSPQPYFITYQRCCRNQTINNLLQGGSTGATFYVELTPEAMTANNSSPVFKNYPPSIICINEPLIYDHAVTDIDGDRVVYSFTHATSSPGMSSDPRAPCYPSPTSFNNNCPPPLRLANYYAAYSATNPMGGAPQVVINANTGMVTGTPNSLGQFVVSVTAEEYRGAVLMSRVIRDFQFNVVFCPKKVETFFANADSNTTGTKEYYFQQCDSLQHTLLNTSRFRQFINSFYWEFNLNGQVRRFTDWIPTITFPDTGQYRGILWLNRGERCYDSAYVNVRIGSDLKADFAIQFDSCSATPVRFINTSRSNNAPLSIAAWEIIGDTIYRTIPNAEHLYRSSGQKNVRLTVGNTLGCRSKTTKTFFWQPLPANLQMTASATEGCAPSQFSFQNLTTPFDTSYKIRWDFGDGTFSSTAIPTKTYTQAGNYPVKLWVSNILGCEKAAILRGGINVHPKPKADFDWSPKALTTGSGLVGFQNLSSSDATNWSWSFGNLSGSSVKAPNYTFRDTGNFAVRLVATNRFGCVDTVVKRLYVEPFASYYLPNAFSPNDDGQNETFVGIGMTESFKSFSMQIFNRWGEIVFRTDKPNEAWNGQKNNTGYELPQGVYLVLVKYTTYKGEAQEVKSFLTLTR